MDRPTYSFKIGQHVFYRSRGQPRGRSIGIFTIVGMVRKPEGQVLYRIKNRDEEHLAHVDELKLARVRPLEDE